VIVFKSVWIPAPPPESEPAMVKIRFIITPVSLIQLNVWRLLGRKPRGDGEP
jgi:hypothetical protein